MRWFRLGLAVVLGAAVALVAPMVIAEVTGPVASVVHAGRIAPRIADEGQTRVVPITRGEKAYLGEFSLAAGVELKPRAREAEEYLYILTGSGVLTVDERSYLVGPRMGIYLPAGSEVGWINGPERLVAVQFFAGPGPSADYERWQIDEKAEDWPQRRRRIRRIPSRVSELEMDSPVSGWTSGDWINIRWEP